MQFQGKRALEIEVDIIDPLGQVSANVLADTGGVEGEDGVVVHDAGLVAGLNTNNGQDKSDHDDEQRKDGEDASASITGSTRGNSVLGGLVASFAVVEPFGEFETDDPQHVEVM